jgi:hypothetical protein
MPPLAPRPSRHPATDSDSFSASQLSSSNMVGNCCSTRQNSVENCGSSHRFSLVQVESGRGLVWFGFE